MNSKELTRRRYGDPLKVLLQDEERSCKGCKHEHSEKLWGNIIAICTLTLRGKRRPHGKRCKDYKEKL